MDVAVAIRRKNEPMILAAQGRFGRFKAEPEQQVRQAQVQMNPKLAEIVDAWEYMRGFPLLTFESLSSVSSRSVRGLSLSPEDVENFSLFMHNLQGQEGFSWAIGCFLSALANQCSGQDVRIHTSNLDEAIGFIGSWNRANLTIVGDTYDAPGFEMLGGRLVIEGSVNHWAGKGMTGGSIIINGHAGNQVGDEMKGGEIHLDGDFWSISENIKGGKIFHDGRQIWPGS